MIKSMFNSPIASNILEQAITDVLKADAIEKTAIFNIFNLINDILQKAKINSANLEEFVAVNESLNSIIRTITKVQKITQIKLQHMENLIQKLENLNEDDDLEE